MLQEIAQSLDASLGVLAIPTHQARDLTDPLVIQAVEKQALLRPRQPVDPVTQISPPAHEFFPTRIVGLQPEHIIGEGSKTGHPDMHWRCFGWMMMRILTFATRLQTPLSMLLMQPPAPLILRRQLVPIELQRPEEIHDRQDAFSTSHIGRTTPAFFGQNTGIFLRQGGL